MILSLILLRFFFVLLASENSAAFVKKTPGPSKPVQFQSNKVDFGLFGYQLEAIEYKQVDTDIDICDQFTIYKFGVPQPFYTVENPRTEEQPIITKPPFIGETGIKVRPKPKGKCVSCCPTGPADIQLQLFSKFQRETPVLLPPVKEKTGNYENLKRASTIIIYIHGFMEITDLGSANNIKNAYLSRADDYAVIIVDWSELVSFPWYFQAVNNIESVAKLLVTFLETYTDAGTINIGNIHMIGFSLGAHVAGHVGQLLRKGLKIRRITALDPALPGFKSEKKRKLSKSAAEFVDVIHTDGGNFGNIEAVGHVDFYPNGGTFRQPGCSRTFLAKTGKLYDLFSCSHNRAHKFFVNSIISPYDFPAVKCLIARNQTKVCNESDTAYMGIAAYFK
ncbi:lipase [Holotrichia oblita]|uniref:Lipase n=1 Tax=Holotrichia oblita TaxID=644536 RepID=A0ACB9SPD1_HOLOL|nr:lipase [Holotrichia oblita]